MVRVTYSGPSRNSHLSRFLKLCACIFGAIVVLFLLLALLIAGLLICFFGQVPRSYPPMADPIEPPAPGAYVALELDGFESPYLGHTGSWDGKGGGLWGSSKTPDLDKEVGMGLRWTFMPVYWSVLEPDGPVDLSTTTPDGLAGTRWLCHRGSKTPIEHPHAGPGHWR